MTINDSFLDSFELISENQTEYSILSDLYTECKNMVFLFELSELNQIKHCYSNVISYINNEYKSFEVRKFSLDIDGELSYQILINESGSTIKDEDLFNQAINISKQNNSYILVKANQALVLMHNGQFDTDFKNVFADKQLLIKSNNEKRNINELELVFENFHSERKYCSCEYIEGGKVKDSVSEKQLRNHLISFLKKVTNLYVVTELCTSQENDEESVDIGVIDSNKEVAIIEVKYFVKKGYFVDANKSAYSQVRFKDGYIQLNKYCVHLNKDDYKIHSAFLYMFYAHSDNEESIRNSAEEYYDEFVNDSSGECSQEFKQHYKSTIYDNMVDVK